MKTFTLKEEHIALLSNSYVSWNSGSNIYGAACIDSKRPYGKSDILGSIYCAVEGKSLYDELDENEISEEMYNKYRSLHRDTETALQIILHTKSFELGEYRLEGYGKDWVKVD